ncbi:MAG: lipopolysaccharide biosynthesis protein [Bacteroidales bacterium]|jgi:O-antigen/teichoic acid export membrane protein
MNESSIKTTSLKSVKWVSLGILLPKLFAPLITILLTIYLSPKDFGIVAICGVFIGFFTIIQGLGITEYIIKDQEIDDEKLNTAFFTNVFLSIIIYLIFLVSTPLIFYIYKEEILLKIFPILSFTIILDSIGNVHLSLLRKKMKFRQIFFINFYPILISIIIILPLAYYGKGVWALVIGSLAKSLVINIHYIISSKWIPKFQYNKNKLKEMFHFGKWVIIEKAQESIYLNIDILLLGYFGNLSITGIYSLARNWIWIVYGIINGPLANIVYPAVSKIQNSIEKLKETICEILHRIILINLPVTIGLSIVSYILFPLIFKEKWNGISEIFAILVIGEGVSRNMGVQRDLFKIINRPDIYPKYFFINILFALITYPIAIKYGIITFCFIRILNDFIYTYIQIILTSKLFKIKFKDYYRISFHTILSTLIMGSFLLIIIFVAKRTNIINDYFLSAILILAGILVYSFSIRLFEFTVYNKIINELKIIIGLKK